MEIRSNIVVLFWSKVDKSGGDNACWTWLAAKSDFGYGVCWTGARTILAHRFSYQIKNGEIPNGIFVLHRCDNPPCVNPAHLFLGTQKENMHDMQNKGRKVVSVMRGEKNGFSKLSDFQVSEIRRRYSLGTVSKRALGREFGVSKTHIDRIVKYICRLP